MKGLGDYAGRFYNGLLKFKGITPEDQLEFLNQAKDLWDKYPGFCKLHKEDLLKEAHKDLCNKLDKEEKNGN